MSGKKNRVHVCTHLIGNIHRPKNVTRPPIVLKDQVEDTVTPETPTELEEYVPSPEEQDQMDHLSVYPTEDGNNYSSSSNVSITTISSISSDVSFVDRFKMGSVSEISEGHVSPKRSKSNSITLDPSQLSVLNPPRRRAGSFLHLHFKDLGSHIGPHSAGPHFHIPTFTITGPSESASKKLSNAFHGLGAFALRRHSNTSLHRTDSMVSLCFRSLSNLISDNNLEALQAFLDSKQIQIDDKDDNGTTALMLAAQQGKSPFVSALLAHGADPNTEDNDNWTPLLLAAKHGWKTICIDLIQHGAEIEHRDMGGWTPIMWASYKGHEDVVELLIEKGADVNAHGNFNISSLIWAAGRGYPGIVKQLLDGGARPNSCDKYGTTALVWASRKGDVQAVKHLLSAGALLDQAGMYSWTALLQATHGNYIEIIQLLLEHKPNVNAIDKDGNTALTIACKEGYYEIVVALLNSGAYVNMQDRSGDTSLIHAVKGGHRLVVEALLKKYVDIDILGKDKKTAVYNAVEKGHTAILKLLLQSNPDLELATKDGDTPLLKAVRLRNAEMVQMLLDKKAKINAIDKRGDTCLHIAMRNRSKAVVEILLRNPKDSQLLYRPNKDQETPYNIDMKYPKTILGQIFGARRLNTNDDNESLLGYELYSSALADMLSEPSLSMPITVGLYARWGSGKSFLLSKLREEMKNFARQWLELGWQWNWAVFWGLWHCAVIGGTVIHLAGASWSISLASTALILTLLYTILIVLWYASRKYEWSWPYTVMLALSNKFNSLQLLLQIVFCHPPGPQNNNLLSQPIRFHFTDQAKSSTQEGEASVINMIVSLSNALENQYGRLCTRLYRAFRPKPVRSTSNWRWRRVCCIPNVLAFEICFICASLGNSALVLYLANEDKRLTSILGAILIVIGTILAFTILANLHILRKMLTALILSPRSHIKRSVNRQPEGFLQALRPEVDLLTDMVKCLDAFTGQQTRLVVVVDALDSCEQDRVLIVLNAIHTLCSEQCSPFIIILAIDPHIISKAVEVNSKRAFTESNIGGWDYLKNMVQLPFYLQNSALRQVKTAQQTSQKKQQFLNAEDITSSLQRSVSARRLSTASEIMSSQEKLKGGGSSRTARKLKASESLASSMNSNLHKAGLSAGPADLSRVLLTDDYFSDVNPRSMQRLMNVLYITGRLLKAFQIEFNWYHLATWVNLTEQWPFRTSWIILHHEMYDDHIDDNTPLKNIYDKVRPYIPALREIEPLMELDRDERKLDVFLGFHRTSLLTSDMKIFLPFTINLDPYIKKVIKDEQQHYMADNDKSYQSNKTDYSLMNSTYPVKTQSKHYFNRNKHHKPPSLPPIYGGMTPIGWPSWPEHPLQPTPPVQIVPQIPVFTQFNSDLNDVHLSKLTVSGICSLIEHELPNSAASVIPILHNQNISGRVLQHCDLNELKGVLNLTFGDWELFKILILTLRDIELGLPTSTNIVPEKERSEKELKTRSSHDSIKSKPSNMEKQSYGQEYQVTLEEQMICGALQTLNEEAMEDVLFGEPSGAPVSDESDSLQLVHLVPSTNWCPTSPPTSLSASPQLSRKSDAILKSRGSFKLSSKKHVSINEGQPMNSNMKTADAPVIVKIEDETAINLSDNIERNRKSSIKKTNKDSLIIKNEVKKIKHDEKANIDKSAESSPIRKNSMRKSTKAPQRRPSSLLFNHEFLNLHLNKDILPNRSKSAEDNSPQAVDNKMTDKTSKITFSNENSTNTELLTRIRDKIFNKSNSIEKNVKASDLESDDESTPLMSSERSSPSPSKMIHENSIKDNIHSIPTPQPYSPSPSTSNSNNRDSSISSLNDNSPIKCNKSRKNKNPTYQKNLSPENHDYTNSDVTISVDFSPSSDYSLSESRFSNNGQGGNSVPIELDCLTHSNEVSLKCPNLIIDSGNSDKNISIQSKSAHSVQMSVLSKESSDSSLKSNYLWRQNAIEDSDEWNVPESSL